MSRQEQIKQIQQIKQVGDVKQVENIKYIMSIDVGQYHMCMCIKLNNEDIYRQYLFSFHDPTKSISISAKMQNLSTKLEEVMQKINEYIITKYYNTQNTHLDNSTKQGSQNTNLNINNYKDFIECAIIEQQMDQTRIGGGINSSIQYAIIMWFATKGIEVFTQSAFKKYAYMWEQIKAQQDIAQQQTTQQTTTNLLEDMIQEKQSQNEHLESTVLKNKKQTFLKTQQANMPLIIKQNSNNKQVASMYVIHNFIDKDLIEIMYQSDFGLNSCKRNKNGSVRMCRFYTQKTKEFVQKYNLDKLDDVADTILMILYYQSSNKYTNYRSYNNLKSSVVPPVKRGRGRPRKVPQQTKVQEEPNVIVEESSSDI